MTQPSQEHIAAKGVTVESLLDQVRESVRTCIQCGTCSGSCPNEFAMDFTPRKLWRLMLAGDADEVFDSRTFALCSACYYCTLRCPRGLPLTEAMATLKQAAFIARPTAFKVSRDFYKNFMGSVRRNGRVNEMEFMSLFFLSRKNPILPLRYAPLGIKFMAKGKVKPAIPKLSQSGPLESIFRKVEEMEQGK
jgi:heterodisulfide reductase subunit C